MNTKKPLKNNNSSSKGKVLVVDDDKMAVNHLSLLLNNAGYHVQIASSAEDAKKLLKTGHFDAGIFDLVLPGTNGLDLAETAREVQRSICIIIITAYNEISFAIDVVNRKIDDYLLKPCSKDELLFRLAAGILRKQIEGNSAEPPPLFKKEDAETGKGELPTLTRSLPVLVWVTNRKGEITFINEAAKDLLEYSPKEMVGKKWDRFTLDSRSEPTSSGKDMLQYRIQIRTAPGRIKTFLRTIRIIWSKDERVLGYFGNDVDISKQILMEQSLKESEEKYRRMVDDSPVGMTLSDGTFHLIYANRQYLDLLGFSTVQELNKNMSIDMVLPEYRQLVIQRLRKRKRQMPLPPYYAVKLKDREGRVRSLGIMEREIYINNERYYESAIMELPKEETTKG